MSLDKALKALKYDVRMLEINFNNGTLTNEELKAYQNTLVDSAANSEPLDLENNSDKLDSH
jgi:hypothetical protein